MTPTSLAPKLTRSAAGLACLLAMTIFDPTAALAQSRDRAPARHGGGRHAAVQARAPRHVAPARASHRVAVRAARGPRFVHRSVRVGPSYRSHVVRSYGVRHDGPFVGRSHAYRSNFVRYHRSPNIIVAQRRHGGVYRGRSYGRHYSRPYYRPYYRYPRTHFSFGLGIGYPYGFLGYPFYSPYYYGYGYPYYGYGYGYGYGGYPGRYYSEYAEDQGGIRLQVTPKEAVVYVDGYYVGVVDDFDGSSQHLTLDAGPHKLEIRAPGFETLSLDINILRNETIRYRGPLHPLP